MVGVAVGASDKWFESSMVGAGGGADAGWLGFGSSGIPREDCRVSEMSSRIFTIGTATFPMEHRPPQWCNPTTLFVTADITGDPDDPPSVSHE
eukprot:scaffold8253_cov57-Cylindrotheca_fusiformis.AAC.2